MNTIDKQDIEFKICASSWQVRDQNTDLCYERIIYFPIKTGILEKKSVILS
jgi:hypothetical protein